MEKINTFCKTHAKGDLTEFYRSLARVQSAKTIKSQPGGIYRPFFVNNRYYQIADKEIEYG